MKMRYAGAVLAILLAGCSASHTASPSSVFPGVPSVTSHGVDPFNLSIDHVIFRYPLPYSNSLPYNMATGSDKNVWFTEQVAPARIGKITRTGAITEFAIPYKRQLIDIAPGTSGTLWFTEVGSDTTAIGKITTSGQVTQFYLKPSGIGEAEGITKGPDGNIWFTAFYNGRIGKITPTGTIKTYKLQPTFASPVDIVAGPDGNLWFTDFNPSKVGKITTSGVITEYAGPTNDYPIAIAAGPDGNLYAATTNGLWRITTSGVITAYANPYGALFQTDIILGPDKQMWLSNFPPFSLTEFDPKSQTFSGTIAPDGNNLLGGLTLGADGDVWIAGNGNNTIDVYEEKITTVGIRLNGELSFTDPNYGFELGYAVGTKSTQTQTISLSMGESVLFQNVDTIPHSAAFLGNATVNSAPWPATFTGSTIKSPAGTAIGTTGWATGSLNPTKKSPIYETGLPGFYMIGDQYDYVSNMMRTVIVVH